MQLNDVLFVTERLFISEHQESDSSDMHRLLSDPAAMRYLPEIRTCTFAETQENLQVALDERRNPFRSKYFFKVLTADGSYVGEIGFTVLLRAPEGSVVNLGWFILPEYWNKGFTTEAAKAVIDYAFGHLDVIKIETGCLKENVGSERVMIKLGLLKEAEFRAHSLHENTLKNRVEYGIVKSDWEKRVC